MSDEKTFEQILESLRSLSPDDRKKAFSTLKRERQAKQEQTRIKQKDLPNSHFSKAHLLKRISNPQNASYEQKILIPEFTFIGVVNQPDFGEVLVTFYPREWSIELKSLKIYV